MQIESTEDAAWLDEGITEIDVTELDLREDLGTLFVCPALPKIPFSFT